MKLQILRKLIPIACLLVSMNALAYDFESGGIYYNISSTVDKTVKVTYKDSNYNSYTGDVVIPSTVTHEDAIYNVTSIGNHAFYGCSGLTSVTIGDSVISIGKYAFCNCRGLISVTIGDSVISIGEDAFCNCSGLTSVTIGDSVTSIGDYAFYNCSGLTSVTIPNSVTSVGSYAFSGCSGMTSITIPNSVTSIGDYAFYNCSGLTSITIPNSVTSIGDYAFDGCSGLTSVTISNSVTQIGNYAFRDCTSLKDLKIEDGTEILELGYNYYSGSSYSSGTGEGLFYDCPLETVYLGRNLSYNTSFIYGYSPFYNQKALKAITIGNNVTSIGENAFYKCSGLTSITIPNSVTSIGDYAFFGCSGLTSVTISNSVTQIGNYAFRYCTSLKDLKIEDGTEILELGYNYYNSNYSTGKGLFYDCPLKTVYLGRNLSYNTSQSYGYSPFYEQKALKTITIGNSVTSIGDYAFFGCSGLTSVTISNSVTQIGNYVFEGCTSLKDLKIEDGTEILELGYNSSGNGEGLFYDCPLETVYLGRNLSYNTNKSYGYSPFYNQKALKTITIGNSVTSIGDNAFRDCSGLTSVTFESITPPSIGQEAFYNVNATFKTPFASVLAYKAILKDKAFASHEVEGFYYMPTSETEVEVTLNPSKYSGDVVIPLEITVDEKKYNVTSIGKNAFANCSGLTSVTITNSVTTIGGSAFSGCSGLTSVTITNSVTTIGGSAFSGCSGLTSITIPNSVTSVGSYAFNGCTSLKDLKIEDGTEILELGYNNYYSSGTGEGLFYDCPLETVYLGRNLSYNASYSYGYSPFYNQKALKAITIGNSVTSIGDYAFYRCSGLTSVTFESITPPSIGQNAFYNVNATFKVPFTSIFAYKAIAELKDKTFGGFEVGGIYYQLTSDMEVEVTFKDKNYKSYTGEVVIPSEITVDEKKYNVTSIGENAFSGCSGLTSVTIPNSVTSIGNSAFYNCSGLTSITIPNSVTSIGDNAFYNCSGLTSITIPNSVTSVGNYAFDNCTSLKDLKIEDGTEILELGYNYYSSGTGEGLFYDCPLETVYLGRNLSYETNSDYGYSPFYNQKALKTITIGNNVTSIGNYAFYNCSGLTSITIPNSVTSIGNYAFYNCSGLTSVTIPNSVTSIGDYAFSGCSGLTSVTFESITPPSIGQYAFYNVNATFKVPYTSIFAYKAIAELKDKTFGGFEVDGIYYRLTSDMEIEVTFKDKNYKSYTGEVVIPSEITVDEKKYNVTSIGENAFSDCSGLTSVTIPNSVTQIGNYAFDNCTSLKDLKIEDGTEILKLGYNNSYSSGTGEGLFYDCSLETVYLGRNLSYNTSYWYGYSPFYEQKALKTITIGNSVTSIGGSAFSGCSGLTSITIPNSVTSVGNYAFDNCTSLKDLKIEDGTEILELGYNNYGPGLFYDCPLETVYLGRNLSYNTSKSYGYSPFYNQKALKAITIGNSVTSIGDYAFLYCSGLTSVTIGNRVTSIGDYAFSGCKIKKTIWLTNTPPQGYANLSSAVHYVANDQYASLNNVTIYPYLSSMFEADGIKYVPVSPSERTCDAIDCAYDTTATNINIENTVSYKGVAMTLKEIKPYTCNTNDYIKQVKINFSGSIDKEAFSGCTAITSAEIKASIIDKEAFYGCSSLETITVNAKSLGTSAFASCATKESAIFEISVQTIGDNSFKGCTKVESITLSDNLISIGDNAFERCSNLKEIVIPDAVKSLGGYAFSGCSSLEDITIGASVATIKESAFSGCSKLPEITIPSNVTSIGDYVFDNCTSLATVVINDRDTDLSFGSNDSNPLFYSCPLDSVYIGGNITYPTSGSKGYSPFYRNTNLRSVVITDKETEISENEFYGCSNLKNISMGDGVETIGKWAFSGCSSLDYFAFGSGMKTIGEEAFSDCIAMTKLISRTTTPPTCGTQALDDINKWTCELFVPESAVTAYQGANQWKEFFFITGTESSGVESTLTDEVDVSVENGNIVIKGADNAMIEVYSLNGQCVYSGIETTISIAAKGLYVVKVNGKSFKVMM